jgi:peptidoglycan pentaglycine glycine transferase (the first glycine)
MEHTYCTSKTEWESLLQHFPQANFLQSWNWGEFQQSLGKQVVRISAQVGNSRGVAQLVVEPAKRGTYAAVAGGPLIDWQNEAFVSEFFSILGEEARKQNCVFLRFRPQEVQTNISLQLIKKISARLAPMHLTADLTLQLDITKTEDELLVQMRKGTRYEIKKAQKLGITTEVTTDIAHIEEFYQHQLEVAQRHNFVPFSFQFLHEQFAAFLPDQQVALINSYFDSQLLASAFIIFYNNEAVYHYGISTEANAKLPGAYATQWAAICEAKKRGCTTYNFWGIAPEGKTDHRFAGVSLFKRGFGGSEVEYLPAHDIPLSPVYWGPWLFETIRKKLRHL